MGIVPQCLHSGYKLLLQLPRVEFYMDEKKALAIQFGLDCFQMAHDTLKDEQRKAIQKF